MRIEKSQAIRTEQEKLFSEYLQSTEDISPQEYAYKYGSDELKKYLDKFEKELAENEKKGIVVN